jgi:hypothetical protein
LPDESTITSDFRITTSLNQYFPADTCRRGPYCVSSHEAVAALRKRGYKARRLEDGFPEWRAAGLPTQPAKSRKLKGFKGCTVARARSVDDANA